jgi:hypothetical protein
LRASDRQKRDKHCNGATHGVHQVRDKGESSPARLSAYPCSGERGSHSSNRLPSGSLAQPKRP